MYKGSPRAFGHESDRFCIAEVSASGLIRTNRSRGLAKIASESQQRRSTESSSKGEGECCSAKAMYPEAPSIFRTYSAWKRSKSTLKLATTAPHGVKGHCKHASLASRTSRGSTDSESTVHSVSQHANALAKPRALECGSAESAQGSSLATSTLYEAETGFACASRLRVAYTDFEVWIHVDLAYRLHVKVKCKCDGVRCSRAIDAEDQQWRRRPVEVARDGMKVFAERLARAHGEATRQKAFTVDSMCVSHLIEWKDGLCWGGDASYDPCRDGCIHLHSTFVLCPAPQEGESASCASTRMASMENVMWGPRAIPHELLFECWRRVCLCVLTLYCVRSDARLRAMHWNATADSASVFEKKLVAYAEEIVVE